MNTLLLALLFALQPDQLTAIGQKHFDANQFSGVVLAAKNGETQYAHAWGLADVAAKTPNTLETKFNIGSINKFFTKTAIAQLAEAGKLSPDDTLRKHLPDYPSPAAGKITIAQLIDHRSGLGDIFGERYDAAPPSKLRELSDFVPLFVDQPLKFEPGTSQAYSNAGYILLGLIIEKVSGEKYREYVQHHIFDPAGMKNTGFYALEETVANRATGYAKGAPNTSSLPGRPSSAGGAYATASDLLRFLNALQANELASEKWTTWVFTSNFGPRPAPHLGFGGGAPGLNAAIEWNDEWTVITLSNFDPPSAMKVAHEVMEVIHGGPAIRETGRLQH